VINKLAYYIKRVTLKVLDVINDRACKSLVDCDKEVLFFREADVQNIPKIKEKIKIGKYSRIRGTLIILPYGGKITIGENCFVGMNSKIWSGDSIEIGNNVLISHLVNIVDTNSHEVDHLERAQGYKKLFTEGHPKEKGSIETAPIVIQDYAWISFGVSILKGVTIGEGAIVAAGSVVIKDVPPYTLVAGNPAKVKKELKPENAKA